MQLDKIELNETDLAKIDGVFTSTRAGYKKSATVVFTNGKSDPRWKGTKPDTFGVTFPQFNRVDEQGRSCKGMCLVDLYAHMAPSVTPAFRGRQYIPAKLAPLGYRYMVVVTVVHELAHVLQAWEAGKRFFRDAIEERISATNRAADYAAVNEDMPNDPYLQDVYEKGARDFARRWSAENGESIHSGKWDFLLPMTTMRGIFQDAPNAYR